jgi:hypothetical protein
MEHKDARAPKPPEGYEGNEPVAVRCSVSDGIAVIRCAPEGSFIDYRRALGELDQLMAYQHGMPMLVEVTSSPGAPAEAALKQRVTALMRFIEPRHVLRVAVLTNVAGVPCAVRAVEHVGRVGILTAVFTEMRQARAWLSSEDPPRTVVPPPHCAAALSLPPLPPEGT